MINLLPDDYKKEVRAARTNVLLIRYIAIFAIAATVLGGIVTAAYIVLESRMSSAQALLEANNARTAPYASIRAEAEALRSSISSAKAIIDQKISYSKLIYEIANATPSGVTIDSLDLDPTTFGTSMTLSASAQSFDAASKLRDEFAASSEVFSSVTLVSLESNPSAAAGDTHPISVKISVIINKGALQ